MSLIARNVLMAATVVSLLAVLHVVTPAPGGLWLRTFYDAMHVPVFGIVAICILWITPPSWRHRQRLVVSLLTVAILAAMSELVQIPTARDASARDFASDIMGAVGFVLVATGLSRGISVSRARRLLLVLLGAASIAVPLAPLANVSLAYVERAQGLPNLVRFESRSSALLFTVQDAELTTVLDETSGKASAVVHLGSGAWPGVAFTDIWPDWGAYEGLALEVENPELQSLPLSIRVHDKNHNQRFDDRFNRRIDLAPGRQRVVIGLDEIREAPGGRSMNMREIDGLILFSGGREAGRRFVIHEITLLGDADAE